MQILIKRFDKSLPLPEYKTSGAVAFDLYCRENTIINPNTVNYVPLNVALKVPKGFWSLLVSRSSTFKLGLMPANGVGVIDTDYCGDNDEIKFPLFNYTDVPVTVEIGTRVAQLVIMQQHKFELVEVDHLDAPDRGGFGTTGS